MLMKVIQSLYMYLAALKNIDGGAENADGQMREVELKCGCSSKIQCIYR